MNKDFEGNRQGSTSRSIPFLIISPFCVYRSSPGQCIASVLK